MIVIRDSDHRKFPRRPFGARVQIHDHIRDRRFTANAVDINPMGMAVETNGFVDGEVVSLRFRSPDGDHDLELSGQVVRVQDGVAGIEFFELEDWVFEELCAWVYASRDRQPLILVVSDAISTR